MENNSWIIIELLVITTITTTINYHHHYLPSSHLPHSSASNCLLQAPFRWRHAQLADAKDHVKGCIQSGTYMPLLKGGLD